ncbi:MAG: nuclear transport factor 2 family protein, partial [Gemmatimonadota bacterium]|nr:nuclear transport factor 2 family protein [Gemmatimonadota bacterium]
PGRGAPVRLDFEEWAAGRDEAVESPERYDNRITAIDVDGRAAMAKTVLEWPEVRYVDYLSLLKIDGEWRIVNKVWDQEPSEEVVARIDETPLAPGELARYAGWYRAGEATDIDVWIEDGRLHVARVGATAAVLFPVGPGEFAPSFDPDGRFVFTTSGGSVTGFELRYEDREIVAERVE